MLLESTSPLSGFSKVKLLLKICLLAFLVNVVDTFSVTTVTPLVSGHSGISQVTTFLFTTTVVCNMIKYLDVLIF